MSVCKVFGVTIHVEILGLLLFLATSLEESVTTNLIIYKTCYVTLGYNETQCAILGTNFANNDSAILEEKVQPHANIIMMTRSMLESIITSILCFFLGTWSDKYGRRPILLNIFAGYTFSYIITAIISSIMYVSPWFLLLRSIPYVLSGGYPSLFAAMLSYMTDVTSEESRGARMGVFEALTSVSIIIGSLCSSHIFNAFGYETIYAISGTSVFSAWLFTYFFIPESVANVATEDKFKNLFKFSLVKSTVNVTFKQRPGNGRILIILNIILIITFMWATFGTASLMFLFLREKFQWSLEKFTTYNSLNNFILVLGSACGPYILHRILHVNEIIVIFFGELSAMISAIVIALASQDWMIYTGTGLKCLAGAVNPMLHCMLSKLVSSEDTGKIFSLITSLQTICTFVIGAPVYTFIYNATLTTFPEAFIFVTVGIYVLEMIIIFFVRKLQRAHIRLE